MFSSSRCCIAALVVLSFPFSAAKAQSMPKEITSVEGITEYHLENGMKILLFPDPTKDTVTINNTIFVGSRHEGYGEAGMAHLLEHMVFKGTPTFPDVPKALREKGAGRSMNGTTWLDRTNYFETMNASDENLEFGIKLEADRMMNSFIRAEDLETEMTVVRNEFERGENSPARILDQRITSAAFEWHNYGKSTIGNRADIERVPVENLRRFYKRFYQPDNAMLVVSGSFQPRRALELAQKYFGSIPRPERKLNQTYTEEPPQDGERLVTLRRVGDVAMVGVAYHIVAGPHPDFPATDILATSLAQAPSGRLYKALVESKLAGRVSGGVYPTHDPSLVYYSAEVVQGIEPQRVADAMLDVLENLREEPLTEEEVERSRSRLLSDWERSSTNSQRLAINLSEWAAQGDWRLYFLYRDRLESATLDDVNRLAGDFFVKSNRTLGMFLPTDEPVRAKIEPTPSLAEMIGDYKGRGQVAMGEKFDVSPANIEARTERTTLLSGVKVTALPKKTMGKTIDLRLTLRFGDVESLNGKAGVVRLLGAMLSRGTKARSRQQLRDELNKYRAKMTFASAPGTLTCSVQVKRENLLPVLELMNDALNNPTFPEDELSTLVQQSLAGFEQQLSDPQSIAQVAVVRKLRPFKPGDPRYYSTPTERMEEIKAVTVDDLKQLHSQMINGKHGELSVVGDFDTKEVVSTLTSTLSSLEGSAPFRQIERPAVRIAEGFESIETPDKANAVYFAGTVIPIRDDHEDFPALLIGNDIFGGAGALASRLGTRVRQKEGLSYGVGTMMISSARDPRIELMIYAISNPENTPKARVAIREELDLIRQDGITEDELEKAKAAYVKSQRVLRTNDSSLARLLEKNTNVDRTMDYVADLEERVTKLTVDEVNAAIRKYIDPDQIFVVTAGDFAGAEASAEEGKEE